MDWEDRIGCRLTLRDLRILLTTVEVGSMSMAASELRVSQPAISKTITQVERVVGARLVTRSSRGIKPTEQGRALLARSRAALRELKAGVEAMDDLSHPKAGELRLAGNQVALSGIVPIVINRLYARRPGFIFNVVPAHTVDDQVRILEQEQAELVVGRTGLSAIADQLRVVELFNDEFVVVAGPNNRWSRRKKIELSELMRETWALPAPGTITGKYVAQIFRANGLEPPQINVVTSSMQLHQRLVLENGFLSLFSASLARTIQGMRILPASLKGEHRSIDILTLKHRTLSPLARLFIEEAKAAVEEGHLSRSGGIRVASKSG